MRSTPHPLPTALAVAGCVLLSAAPSRASFAPPEPIRVEPPRFEVPDGARLPLQSTHHEVRVVGPIAHVSITQTYVNEGTSLLDATYVFPGSPRSAVASLVMRIGDRTVKADLREKEEARAVFEKARREGYRASLLEQDRPNVFRMGLTNIRPGEKIEVSLGYTERVLTKDGVSELALPAVVAPRFGAEAGSSMGERPTLAPGAGPAWSADLRLSDGLAVTEVSSPTHDVSPTVDAQGQVQVKLRTKGEKEFVLRWRVVAGTHPEAGLTVYEGEDENFFMMTVAPPQRISIEETPPREVAFVLDVSCSMRGFPLDVAKTVMRESLGKLRPKDHFNVLFFSGSGWTYAPAPIPATRTNVANALEAIDAQHGGGGTQLVAALDRIASAPRAPNLARTVVVVTDGLVSFEQSAFAKVREKLHGTAVFTLGIGSNINRMLVEGLARAGGGASYVAHDQASARHEASRLVTAMAAPVLTRMKLDIEGLDAYDLEPPVLPDLYANQPVVVVGKYRGELKGSLRLSGQGGRSSFERTLQASAAVSSAGNDPLRALWARRKLQRVADDRNLADGGADKATITAIGLRYGLLTEHTAFVAVDSEGGKASGAKSSVEQPGANPHGIVAEHKAMAPPAAASGGLHIQGYGRGGGGRARRSAPAPMMAPPPAPEADAVASEREVAEDRAVPKAKPKKEERQAKLLLEANSLIVRGDVDAGAARAAVARLMPRLQALLDASIAAGQRVVVDLEIDAQGKVTAAKVLEGSLGSSSVSARLLKALRTLQLPAGAGGLRLSLHLR